MNASYLKDKEVQEMIMKDWEAQPNLAFFGKIRRCIKKYKKYFINKANERQQEEDWLRKRLEEQSRNFTWLCTMCTDKVSSHCAQTNSKGLIVGKPKDKGQRVGLNGRKSTTNVPRSSSRQTGRGQLPHTILSWRISTGKSIQIKMHYNIYAKITTVSCTLQGQRLQRPSMPSFRLFNTSQIN